MIASQVYLPEFSYTKLHEILHFRGSEIVYAKSLPDKDSFEDKFYS